MTIHYRQREQSYAWMYFWWLLAMASFTTLPLVVAITANPLKYLWVFILAAVMCIISIVCMLYYNFQTLNFPPRPSSLIESLLPVSFFGCGMLGFLSASGNDMVWLTVACFCWIGYCLLLCITQFIRAKYTT